MDVIFWLIMAVVLYKFIMPSAPSSSEGEETQEEYQHLTETQRRWRAMKREMEMEKIAADGDDHATKFEQIVKLQTEMRSYILEHKRPFHPLVWLFDTINPRLFSDYCKHLAVVFGIFFFVSMFAEWTTFFTLILGFNVLTVDFLMYRRQLLLEVTDWNPEFQEKFVKKFEILARGVDIP